MENHHFVITVYNYGIFVITVYRGSSVNANHVCTRCRKNPELTSGVIPWGKNSTKTHQNRKFKKVQ